MTALTTLAPMTDAVASAKPAPVLTVTRGLHQGGHIRLDAAAYTLGSTAEADFILSDPGIEPRHLVLRLADDKVFVEALGGEVQVEERQGRLILVPAGSGYRGQLPLNIALGQARLNLEPGVPGRAATSAASVWYGKPRLLLALALMFICACAFAFRSEPLPPLAQPREPAPQAPKPPSIAQAQKWLDQQLLAADLKSITVNEAGGQLIAQGHYAQAHKPRWIALQQAFDQQFGQHIVLRSTVSAQAEAARPRVRLQAVWFGDNPYLINDSGKRLYPGTALADGWVLERIEDEQVVLARGEERFTLTL
ncbi:SctD/MshK family protein [Pseudomonas sp. X10]